MHRGWRGDSFRRRLSAFPRRRPNRPEVPGIEHAMTVSAEDRTRPLGHRDRQSGILVCADAATRATSRLFGSPCCVAKRLQNVLAFEGRGSPKIVDPASGEGAGKPRPTPGGGRRHAKLGPMPSGSNAHPLRRPMDGPSPGGRRRGRLPQGHRRWPVQYPGPHVRGR